MRRAVLLAALLASAALPAAASAGEVTGTLGSYSYVDTAGNQTNVLAVSRTGNDVVFTDSAGMTENSSECSQAVPTIVTCTPTGGGERSLTLTLEGGDDEADASAAADYRATMNGGAGNDELTAPPDGATMQGGPDNDTLTGSAVSDSMQGGEGDDDLVGNGGYDDMDGEGGADDLQGGDGNDSLEGGTGPDVLAGGADEPRDGCGDTIEYDESTANLQISLDAVANDDTGDGDTIGDGIESIDGGSGNDTLVGNDGFNCLGGAAGNDTLQGLGGNDDLDGRGGADTVDGGAGDDDLTADDTDAADGGDVYIGGDGVDGAVLPSTLCDPSLNCTPREITITLDGQANDGAAGEGDNVGPDIEDVGTFGFFIFGGAGGSATVTGSAAFNYIYTDAGNDTVDPAGGSDSVQTGEGEDVVNARDGFADRIDCGPDADSANVDQLDTVKDCETVNREEVVLFLEDRPPAVTLDAPATVDPTAPGLLRADASDDRGVQRVTFMDDERVLCTDEATPYECSYQPGGRDVGPNLLTAVAVDSAEQGAFASKGVTISKFRAAGLTVAFRRGRASGRLRLPAGLATADGCSGAVRVTVKIGRRTITHRVKLSKGCRYRVRIRVRGGATIRARFLGNKVVRARNSAPLTIS